MLFGDLSQQNLQQLHRRTVALRPAIAFDSRQVRRIARQAALDRRENFRAALGALHAARKSAQIAERCGVARRGQRDLDQHVVFQHARAWHVARLSLVFAPCGDFHQNAEIARFPGATLEALPGVFRLLLVGRGRGQRAHLVGEPVEPA